MGMEGKHEKDLTYGNVKLKKARVDTTFRTGDAKIGNGEHAPILDLPELWDRLQGPDCND